MSYIRFSTPNPKGVIYATLVDSVRKGNKVEQKYVANLGRVINRSDGIFKSRDRGIYNDFTCFEIHPSYQCSF